MNFGINPSYLTDVTIRREWNSYTNKDTVTNEDLVKVLKGNGSCSVTSTEDHPEFAQLRDQLEQQGYIWCERNWSNGDRVLKPFSLNSVAFEPGDQFCCAVAMKYHLERAQR
jgi:hypothetical protein